MPVGAYERTEKHRAINRTHGRSGTPEHRAWKRMKDRCYNPKSADFKDYGGRGITVHHRWRESFEAFLADMGARPSPKHSIDRINTDWNYEPGNCRWATATEQVRNRRIARTATINGETRPLIEWARIKGIRYLTLLSRIHVLGLTPEQAVLKPLSYRGQKDYGMALSDVR